MRTSRLAGFAVVIAGGLFAGQAGAQVHLTQATLQSQLLCSQDPDDDGPLWMTGGLGVGDFNRDGLPDIFSITGAYDTDKLFLNVGNGVFEERGLTWGLTEMFVSNAVAVADFNGDGWHDVLVTALGGNHLYRNNGNGTFTDIAASAGVDYLPAGSSASDMQTFGAAWGDYDLDGNLDLFIANWQACCQLPTPCTGCGEGNRLYRNNGDETFADVTESAIGSGLDGVLGFQPCFADMDGDLYPEILLAADFETSRYLVNNGDGTFTNQTVSSGTGLDDNGMGQTVGDFDNDLRLDWYVTSIHKDDPLPGNNPGNMLYKNLGGHTFLERSVPAGVNNGGWGWGAVAVDLDHDGFLDIVEVNGREAPGGEWEAEQAYLFRNKGNGLFEEMAQDSGFDHHDSGRSVVWMDTEQDGDLDLVVFTAQGPLHYYRNDVSNTHRWIEIELDTSNNRLLAPDGFGTRLQATFQGKKRIRYMDGAPSYLGTSELMVHFGFGNGPTSLDELKITWPRGYETILTDVPLEARLTIHAPDPADLTADAEVDVDDLVLLITGWGPVSGGNLVADLDLDGAVDVDDLVELITAWGPATAPVDP